jgi:1-acyl-sn-glycerol-3-phosphate acyltransferase
MLLYQIALFLLFIFFILCYSYILILPILLIDSSIIINYTKKIAQSFITILLQYGFKSQIKLVDNSNNITEQINENPELIDIVLCNHISSIDFLIMITCLKNFNIEMYNFVLKDQIIYIPIIGFIMYTGTDIKLYRDWNKDKNNIELQLNKLLNNNKKQVIIIFPEGTRFTEDKLKLSQDYAKNNNINVFNNLLIPKSKGLWCIVNYLKNINKLGRIWDVSLVIPGFIKKQIHTSSLFNNLDNIIIDWKEVTLTENYKDPLVFKNWLYHIWKNKDLFIKNYYLKNYKIINPIDKIKIIDNINIILLIVLFIGLVLTKYGRYYLLLSFIFSYLFILLSKHYHLYY